MRNISRACFTWFAAALLAVVLIETPSASAVSSSPALRALKNEMRGVPLRQANIKQLSDAVYNAIKKDPGLAVQIVVLAIQARTPISDFKDKAGPGRIPCNELRQIVGHAIGAAVDQASAIVTAATALSPDPGCTDSLQSLLSPDIENALANGDFSVLDNPGESNVPSAANTATNPGPTGFGSAPGGATAVLPIPTQPVVTSVTNG